MVAASDGAGRILWTRDYLMYQGHGLEPAVLYQDNMSNITLMSTITRLQKTRLSNIRYFWIKDRIEKEELKVKFMCTNDISKSHSRGTVFTTQECHVTSCNLIFCYQFCSFSMYMLSIMHSIEAVCWKFRCWCNDLMMLT